MRTAAGLLTRRQRWVESAGVGGQQRRTLGGLRAGGRGRPLCNAFKPFGACTSNPCQSAPHDLQIVVSRQSNVHLGGQLP